jgi:hypothetical protein
MKKKLLIIILLLTGALCVGGIILKITRPKTAIPQRPKTYISSNKAKLVFAPETININTSINHPLSVQLVLFPEQNPIDTITVNLGFNPQVLSKVAVVAPHNPVIQNTFTLVNNSIDTKKGTITLKYVSASPSAVLKSGFPLAQLSFTPIQAVKNEQLFYFLPGTEIVATQTRGVSLQSVENSSVLGEVVPLKSK